MIIQQQPTWRQMQRQQQRYFWDDCPCCWNGCAACSNCTVSQPSQYVLTVAGITDDVCTNCERWNGEFILTNDCLIFPGGNTCRWSSPVESGTPCAAGCGNCSRWQVVFGSTDVELMADGNLMAAYTYGSAIADCDQTIVFNYFADSLACINWPATLTLTPL